MLTRLVHHAMIFTLAGSLLATAALAESVDDTNKMNTWISCISNARTTYIAAYGACSSLIAANPEPYNQCIQQAQINYDQAMAACGSSPALHNGSSAVDTTGNTMHGVTGGENGAQSGTKSTGAHNNASGRARNRPRSSVQPGQ